MPPTFYEFFAGGGMARAGLGPGWTCAFANDFDARKAAAYQANWGIGEISLRDVAGVQLENLPGRADLMWGSFPCQDLSEAGTGGGLCGARSGAFFPFWELVRGLVAKGRAPRIVAIENVRGALTAEGGASFAAICAAFASTGYRFGPMIIDAALFVPQSRPRLFVIGVAPDVVVDVARTTDRPEAPFHSANLVAAVTRLPREDRDKAVWWRVPAPPLRTTRFYELLEDDLPERAWRSPEETRDLLALMAPIHLAKVEALRSAGVRAVGAVYRRTRGTPSGGKTQRAEVRFDDLAGCLRTPAGGSSRQSVLVIEDGVVRSRLLSPRETARLMGLGDDYILPRNATEAYHLTGDGVVTQVVGHLATTLFEPLLANCSSARPMDEARRPVPSLEA